MSNDLTSKAEIQQHKTNMSSEENHPCLKEHKASLKCLDNNDYDQAKCAKYFANYQSCMGFWNKVKSERRMKGIRPLLPPLEEREAIMRDRFKN